MNKIPSNTVFIIALPQETNFAKSFLGYPIIYSGVGKINASIAVNKAFNQNYKNIINIGSCGSLHYPSGKILEIGTVFQDIDGTPLCDYGETPFERNSDQIIINPNKKTTCFTTDYFYDHSQVSKYSPKYLECINKYNILDMECFALAKTCKSFNLSFSSYKWVSDDGDASNWEANCKTGLEQVSKLLSI